MSFTSRGIKNIMQEGVDGQYNDITIRLYSDQQDFPNNPTITHAANWSAVSASAMSLINNVITIPSAASFDVIAFDFADDQTGTLAERIAYKEDIQISFVNPGTLTFNLTVTVPFVPGFGTGARDRILKTGIGNQLVSLQFKNGSQNVGSSVNVTLASSTIQESPAEFLPAARISLATPASAVSISGNSTVDRLEGRFATGASDLLFEIGFFDSPFTFSEPGTLTVDNIELVMRQIPDSFEVDGLVTNLSGTETIITQYYRFFDDFVGQSGVTVSVFDLFYNNEPGIFGQLGDAILVSLTTPLVFEGEPVILTYSDGVEVNLDYDGVLSLNNISISDYQTMTGTSFANTVFRLEYDYS